MKYEPILRFISTSSHEHPNEYTYTISLFLSKRNPKITIHDTKETKNLNKKEDYEHHSTTTTIKNHIYLREHMES